MCVTLGMLGAEDQHLVSHVDEPLPAKRDGPAQMMSPQLQCSKDDSSSDEASLFITPEPRSRKALKSLHSDDCKISDELLCSCTTLKRKRGSSQRENPKKPRTLF